MIEQPKTNALDAVLGLQRTVDRAERESSDTVDSMVGCPRCGGQLATIRGRHPQDPPRAVCPTCLCEQMEFIARQADRAGNWAVECAKNVVPANAGLHRTSEAQNNEKG